MIAPLRIGNDFPNGELACHAEQHVTRRAN
jgi:hypothetical protein